MRERTKSRSLIAIAAVVFFELIPNEVSAKGQEPSSCPANFSCSRRLEEVLASGLDGSRSLRLLVEELASQPDVHLDFEFRRQKPGKHAQSFLKLEGSYVRTAAGMRRQVTGISGEVVLPRVAYGFRQIELLAHELRHVSLLLEGEISHGSAEEEEEAIRFEQQVRDELEGAARDRSASVD